MSQRESIRGRFDLVVTSPACVVLIGLFVVLGFFMTGSAPADSVSSKISSFLSPALAGNRHAESGIQLLQPTSGLQIAMDPRIPRELQAFAFRISKNIKPARVQWVLNGKLPGETGKDVMAAFQRRTHRTGQSVAWRPNRAGRNLPGGVHGKMMPSGIGAPACLDIYLLNLFRRELRADERKAV